ncbi:hypothetical protein L3X38_042433 [Prunus dulcis]|uniref:Uncharacterized protein n=1 Tax=Prunus dulcis TaxID=3755 RepID=A0AAD4UUY3_PRUDU|nr:hypothetical protein L3X38_042433 [Prunus dulcis]
MGLVVATPSGSNSWWKGGLYYNVASNKFTISSNRGSSSTISISWTKLTSNGSFRSLTYPHEILQDVLVKMDKFILPADFIVLDMEEDVDIPIILPEEHYQMPMVQGIEKLPGSVRLGGSCLCIAALHSSALWKRNRWNIGFGMRFVEACSLVLEEKFVVAVVEFSVELKINLGLAG